VSREWYSNAVIAAGADHIVRAMTMDGAFRIMAAITTQTCDAAIAAQNMWGTAGDRLAELITCAAIVRETTQPGRRVQIVWKIRGGPSLIADALPDGSNRGIVNNGSQSAKASNDSLLQVNYTLPTGQMHQGIVAVDDDVDAGTAVMRYMHESEQIVTMTAAAAIRKDGSFARVGGYLVQVLPEATPEATASLLANLELLPPLAEILQSASHAREIVAALFLGFPYQELAFSELRFGCTCSESRVIMGILTLGPDEIDSIIAGEMLDVRCDACGKHYPIDPIAIRSMRDLRARGAEPS
jgi:molecular chaperone Hsp33